MYSERCNYRRDFDTNPWKEDRNFVGVADGVYTAMMKRINRNNGGDVYQLQDAPV